MNLILNGFTRLFDPARQFWEKETTHKTVSGMLVLTFLLALGAIELNRQGLLPDSLGNTIPKSHYMAINLAFTLVLILEVLGMIFTLPGSLSRALGKQFEILALIFLRNAFKELAVLPEPISLSHHHEVLWHILSYGFGAVAIFALLGIYTKMLKKLDETLASGPSLDRFIAAKKAVALVILVIFCGMGLYNGQLFFTGKPVFHFFQYFYTILIFSDILLVLIAQSFLPEFPAVFRNSGYALATLLIRLSLTAPAYYNVLIGLSSLVLAILLTLVYNQFYAHNPYKTKR
jgi:hypothetical protein